MADETKLPEELPPSDGAASETLLLIPLDDTVVFPTMSITLPVDVGDDERVLLAPRSDGEYAGNRQRYPAHRVTSAAAAAASRSTTLRCS